VRLVADHGEVLEPIKVTELDRILDIYPTVSDALQHNKSAKDAEDTERR
jgi:anti-sigma B factor antagonist